MSRSLFERLEGLGLTSEMTAFCQDDLARRCGRRYRGGLLSHNLLLVPFFQRLVSILSLHPSVVRHLTNMIVGVEDLISRYLNGPRLLSSSHLSHLTISQSPSSPSHFDILLATTHFVGDGMALHTLMNDFYGLVGKGESVYVLEGMLEDALEERQSSGRQGIPSSTEERLATHPQATSALKRAASRTAYTRTQSLSVVRLQTLVLLHSYSATY